MGEKKFYICKHCGNMIGMIKSSGVNAVCCGDPMTEEHYIAWIYLETEQGGQRKKLAVGSKPEAEFALAGGDKVVGVYEYCNLHGLWLTKVE